jgi:hypothetical protein
MSTITPFVKRMRTVGGTMYTFSSATEDIGLNINERNNVVKMSHYALLDIPSIDAPITMQQNRFNVLAIPGAFKSWLDGVSVKDGRVVIAESFQNYALNLEANILNQNTYNPNLLNSVTERVFWKWLKETGAIRWQNSSTGYFEEETDTDTSVGYSSIVKCIGTISAGSVRTDNFGTYNETYVLVPTSYGQTRVFFKQEEDDNYKHGIKIQSGQTNILGREAYTSPHPDALDFKAYYDIDASNKNTNSYAMSYNDNSTGYLTGWWTTAENIAFVKNSYYTDSSAYLISGVNNIDLKYTGANTINFKRSKVDCLKIEFNENNLAALTGYSATGIFDTMAMSQSVDDTFNFNAILIYYTVYNKTLDKVLATNLLGILFLDAPSGNTASYPIAEITMPSITKIQSGPSGFGTSYSFRVNIKSDNMMDDTGAVIYDESTSAQTALEDFSDVFSNLEKSVNILNQHTSTINYITEQYNGLQNNNTQVLNQVTDLQQQLNTLTRDITGTTNTIPLFIAGNDPLGDSSIYMKNGNVGINTSNPLWALHVDGSIKTKDLVIEKAIRDTSNNILLGIGSPLQLGSSTNYRNVTIYTGGATPGLTVNSSNYVTVDGSITVNGNQIVNGKLTINGSLNNTDLTNTNAALAQKAAISGPIFTNSFGIGDWKFKLSGNNLILTYLDVSLFKFGTDGSLSSFGKMNINTNII